MTVNETIQSLLNRMEMTRRDLAREAKLSLASIEKTLAHDGRPSIRTQLAIEFALNTPLWSSAEEFQRAKMVKEQIGFSPEVESLKKLKYRARWLGIKRYGDATSKPVLTALILRELAAREKHRKELEALMENELNGGRGTRL